MEGILRKIYYCVLKLLPAKIVINIENLFTYGRFLSKDRLEYFGEKIQWIKLYGNLEKYTDFVDKYKVREYISNKIGDEFLIPLIGVYNSPDEIDYNKLPNSFVLKLNHGSGYNIIIKDKNEIDKKKLNIKLKKWLKEDYSKIKKEVQYKNVKRKIICEKFINDKDGQLLDYKFFCFDGKPEFVKVDSDRFTGHRVDFFDMKWNKIQMMEENYLNCDKLINKPENFEKMIEIAEKLSNNFQFVRVDLYNVDGKIYFGELTFTPASGRHPFKPLVKDKEIAERIKI